MNKVVKGIILILILTGCIILVIFRSRSPFGKGNSSFLSDPEKEITRIELSEGKDKLSLIRDGDKWLINGKQEARKSGVLFIISILQDLKIKSPVSVELFKSEVEGRGIEPVRVKVFENRRLIKSFLVFKTTSNIYGNIMKLKSGSKPFIVYIHDFEGDIGSVFTTNELFWQPYSLFTLLPSQISSMSLENLSDTVSSFLIVNNNNHFSVSNLKRELQGWDSSRVKRYLSYFTWIPFESWALDIDPAEKKRVESLQPLYRITVNSSEGNKTVLRLWERMTTENGLRIKDSNRLLGKTDNIDEFFVLRYFDIDPILKKRSYFFPE
jgi:hypothetical protein